MYFFNNKKKTVQSVQWIGPLCAAWFCWHWYLKRTTCFSPFVVALHFICILFRRCPTQDWRCCGQRCAVRAIIPNFNIAHTVPVCATKPNDYSISSCNKSIINCIAQRVLSIVNNTLCGMPFRISSTFFLAELYSSNNELDRNYLVDTLDIGTHSI